MPKLLNLPPARILITIREWFDYKISHCVIFTLKWMGSGDKIVCFGCISCHIAALIAMILEGILLWKCVFYDPSRNVLKYLRKTRIFCGEVVLARGNYKTTHFLICVKSWGSGWAGLEKTSAVPSNTTQPPRSLHPLLLDNRKKNNKSSLN